MTVEVILVTGDPDYIVVSEVQEVVVVTEGEQGPQGPQGAAGSGMPTGGTTGQLLAKASNTDFDDHWVDAPQSGVWGQITGSLASQTDLSTALGGKLAAASNLSDLADKPTARTNLGVPAGSGTSTGTNTGDQDLTTYALKSYVDGAVTGLWEMKGGQSCSANPNYPAANKGDAYVVTAAGKIGGASGVSVDVGDVFVASADNAGGTEASVGASWLHIEHNLVGALLAANNLADLADAAAALANLGGVPTTRTVNGHALSGNVTVSASDVGLGNVTNDVQTKAAIVPNTAPAAGQMLVGNAGGTAYAPVAVSGDGTVSAAGALSVTKTGGVAFGALATQGVPASSGQVVINSSGALAGDAGLTYDATNKALSVGGATVTTSNPVGNFSQTWNAGAVTFTGFKINVTDTASAAASLLVDLQVGGASKFKVAKDGSTTAGRFTIDQTYGLQVPTGQSGALSVGTSGILSYSVAAGVVVDMLRFDRANQDVVLVRDAAGILAQRNGANAQTFRVYNSTDGTNSEWGVFGWSANGLRIGTETAGTGTVRSVLFRIGGSTVAQLNGSGLSFGADNTYDIGFPAIFRPRSGYFATSIEAPRVKVGPFTVATLPSAATAGAGALSAATDLLSLTNGSTATSGGSLKGIVKSDGTNWIVLG